MIDPAIAKVRDSSRPPISVEALEQTGVEAAGKAAKGAGSAVQRLFGGQKKR